MDKRGKALLSAVLIILLLSIILVISVKAETNNIKEYDGVNKIVTIKNPLEIIAEIQLLSEQHRRVIDLNDYVFEMEFTLPDSYSKAIKKIDFYQKNTMILIDDPNFELKYYDPNSEYEVVVNDYEEVCDGKANETCEQVLIGTHKEIRIGQWVIFDALGELPAGKTIIRGYYPDLKRGEIIEWIPTLFEVEVNEWADFGTATRMEYYTDTRDTSNSFAMPPYSYGQTFTVGNTGENTEFTIKGLSLQLSHDGSPSGTVIIELTAVGGDFLPTGGNLSIGTIANSNLPAGADTIVNISMSDYNLSASTSYAFVIKSVDTVKFDEVSVAANYTGGNAIESTDSGASYHNQTWDAVFEIWGEVTDTTPPETTTPTINPSAPIASNNLECNATLTDNQQTSLTAYWTWYKNNVTNLSGIKTGISHNINTIITTLLSGNTSQGEEWKCGVTPYDGYQNGTAINSSSVEVYWGITFNVTDSFSSASLNNVIISCNYTGFDQAGDTTNTYGPYAFPDGSYLCTFEEDFHFDKTIIFNADGDKTVPVLMPEEAGLSIEEHTWLEAIYNCINGGDCSLYNLLLQVNDTVENIWEHTKPTDESVVVEETIINRVVNSTHNLTIDYNISIPIKAGYSLGAFLPVRIGYWFLNESNTTCHNQGTKPESVEDPYCQPLIIETIGPMGGYVSFTVVMRPDLPEDEYSIKRIIDIDPNNVWINYGQEVIGTFMVTESISGYGASVETTEENMPDTTMSKITGAVIGAGQQLLSGWQLVIIMAIIGLVLIVFIISKNQKN